MMVDLIGRIFCIAGGAVGIAITELLFLFSMTDSNPIFVGVCALFYICTGVASLNLLFNGFLPNVVRR